MRKFTYLFCFIILIIQIKEIKGFDRTETIGNRQFFMNMPKDKRGMKPLMIAIHGEFSSAESMEEISELGKEGRKNGYVSIFSQSKDDLNDMSFNAGGCCGQAQQENVDDVGYFREMIDFAIKKYKVDPAKVFVIGWGNGGMMGYRLACELSDKLAGVVSFGGNLVIKEIDQEQCKGKFLKGTFEFDKQTCDYEKWLSFPDLYSCEQTKEVAIMTINGKLDQMVNYNGEVKSNNVLIPTEWGPNYFRKKYGCRHEYKHMEYYQMNKLKAYDYSRCIGTFTSKWGTCLTRVLECKASKSGHYWWSSNTPITNTSIPPHVQKQYGPSTQTFNMNEQIFDFLQKEIKKIDEKALDSQQHGDL